MNLKKVFLLIITLIIVFPQIYSNENINSYEYLKLEINNNISYGISKESGGVINSLSLTSYFFPTNYDDSQALNNLTSSLSYEIRENNGSPYLFFDIKNNDRQENIISNTFIIQSTIFKPKISTKIPFPKNINEKYKTYTEFSGLIDTNEDIYAQASKLAQGEDDTFIIASKIAKWIQEDINYDLSTITQNPNQKSSEVFVSKAGVCQEITHLYISMMRSLGIPARVVTGYAYTNSEEVINLVGSNWGGHAWAEVLIGDKWVPFDLTYNQYGYVDASHIVLDKSKEIRKQSILVKGRGKNFKITPNSLGNKNSFHVLEQKKQLLDPGFEVEIDGPNKLSSNSYGHIKIKISNTQNYYQNIFLNLVKVQEIELLDLQQQMIILKPLEEKEILFRYKIPELDKGFIYTFPFTLYNQFFEETFNVSVQEGNQNFDEFELPLIEISNQSFSNNSLQFSCTGKVNYPDNTLLCTINNPNNYELYNVEICSSSQCQYIDMKVNEQKSIELKTQYFETQVTVKYDDIKETTLISIPKPAFEITTISKSKQKVNINYSIKNKYQTISSKIIINSSLEKRYYDKNVVDNFNLNPGNYTVNIQILNENEIIDTFSKVISIEELTLLEKIKKFFSNIFLLLF